MLFRVVSFLALSLAVAVPEAALAQPVLPETYRGYFHWSGFGEAPQDVALVLDRPRIEAGVLIASGREYYFAGGRYQEASIAVRIDVAKLRFELRHLPDPTNFTDGSCVPEVLVGRITADLTSIAGPLVEDGDSPAIPDFAFAASRMTASR